jgi:hypothetical protein
MTRAVDTIGVIGWPTRLQAADLGEVTASLS